MYQRMIALLSPLIIIPAILLHAQPPVDLQQAFLNLSHDEVLMNLSAHPDDEDGATLAYYGMKYGIRTYSVLFTRGEGGQNEKGPELYAELGALRSVETEQAGKILGTHVRFLDFVDFGFSKTATETFRVWGGQAEVLRRLVYIIRVLKPDVIFTNHNTVEGHGHHQAVAITAIAAFDAAADSTSFPEQLRQEGVTLWQPRKLFFRNPGRTDKTADVVHNIEEVNALRKQSYLDIATAALRMHKTQGLERADLRRFTRGLSLYRLVRANSLYDRDTTTFFSGLNIWSDPVLAPLVPVRTGLSGLSADQPTNSLLRDAASLLHQIDSLNARRPASERVKRILRHWQEDLESVVALAGDLQVSFSFKDPVVVPRQKVACALDLKTNSCSVSDVQYQFDLPRGWAINEANGIAPQIDDHTFRREFSVIVGDTPPFTLPKWKEQYHGLGEEQGVAARIRFRLNGFQSSISTAAIYDVAPPLVLSVTPEATRIAPDLLKKGKVFRYAVKNFLPHKTAGRIRFSGPPGWRAETATFTIDKEDSTASGSITVKPPDVADEGEYTLSFATDGARADVIVKIFDVAVTKEMSVGIVKSYDTTLETAVDELGIHPKLLDAQALQSGDLSQFATILIDIRAYLVRSDLTASNKRLLDYVQGGGNLVVMYQRDQEWNEQYSPFPIKIGPRRVTVEDVPVTILQPDHPLLNKPNKISDADWLGWKQERGLYFPSVVAQEYSQLLSMHDPDEPPLSTGYIVAHPGRGSYIYTSLVWYRQLKEIQKGAFRCFANMLSYPTYRR